MVVGIWVGVVMVAGLSPAWADPTPISSVPYTINQSGAYYFTRNLKMVPDQNGITVRADDVTIDLNGFSLIGPGDGNSDGISMKGRCNVEVRNGTIQGWGGAGVIEQTMDGTGHRMVDLRITLNGFAGVCLIGDSHLVKDCTGFFNGYAILVGPLCMVTGNVTSWNFFQGIDAGYGCNVMGNTCGWNGGDGINVGEGCLVQDNMVLDNNQGIMIIGNGACVKNNTLRANDTIGILVDGTDNVIEENVITDSNVGIRFGQSGNFYANNRAADCGTCYSGSATDGGGNHCF